MSIASLAFEALVCVLLLAAAVMCWRVDRRLRAMREGQDGLRDTIGALNDAVDRARASLAALDRASREHGASLREEVETARKLADELRFLNDDAEARVERGVRGRRERTRPAPAEPAPVREGDAGARRRLEALKALR